MSRLHATKARIDATTCPRHPRADSRSGGDIRSTHCIQFRRITEGALRACQSWFILPAVHTLLVLSSICAFLGDEEGAQLHVTSAMRFCYGLQLNIDLAQPPRGPHCGYIGKAQTAECVRRAFWLAYIKSVFWKYSIRSPSGGPRLQVNTRLSYEDAAYEAGTVTDSPTSTFPTPVGAASALSEDRRLASSPMALMVHAAAALEDVVNRTHLGATLPPAEYAASLATCAHELAQRLKCWRQLGSRTTLLHSAPISAELHVMDTCVAMGFHRCARADLLTHQHKPSIPTIRRATRQHSCLSSWIRGRTELTILILTGGHSNHLWAVRYLWPLTRSQQQDCCLACLTNGTGLRVGA